MLDLRWGEYVATDPEDDKKLIDSMKVAVESNFATRRMAVRKLRRTLDVDSVESALEAIEEEFEEREKRALEAAQKTGPQLAPSGSNNPGAEPPNPS